jgi:hypothetical protein
MTLFRSGAMIGSSRHDLKYRFQPDAAMFPADCDAENFLGSRSGALGDISARAGLGGQTSARIFLPR